MKECGSEEWIPAAVPGSVFGDLLAAGKMEEPWYRDNELDALARMEKDYCYETEFDADEELLSCDEVLLIFHGLDTLATVSLNGEVIAEADNMHRCYEFPVKSLLRLRQNRLNVLFHSPTRFIRESYENDPIHASAEAMRGIPRLRKAHCMMGWDWGARIPDAGIWRPVELKGVQRARLVSVYTVQKHEPAERNAWLSGQLLQPEQGIWPAGKEQRQGSMAQAQSRPAAEPGKEPADTPTKVTLTVTPEVYLADGRQICGCGDRVQEKADLTDYTLELTLLDPDGELADAWEYDLTEKMTLTVDQARLWWPNGYGPQPLYTLKAILKYRGSDLDAWQRRIGLRTLTVERREDEWGESFCHVVNGLRMFALGADYIPEDNLLGRVTPERTRRLLEDAALANHNTIRVWGGGYYPDDFFYDACDELGLVVWQDFMFACCVYDLDEGFEKSITAEFIDNVRRLRHHASLALWCGNNEMESFIAPGRYGWCWKPSQMTDYIRMYEHILPKITAQYDPQTFYWPSSPSSGGAFDNPNDPSRGDVHYWDVWHGGKPFTEYRKFRFRYLSEFGFQSFPGMKTIESFTLPEDRNIFSYIMEKHQRNNSANGIIMRYMEQTYLYPTSFKAVVYASQMLQADAIRYGVEHFRRHRGVCMGTVVWQLNDIWPVASWASIDYFGRWKALHYMEKRFFAPLLLSCEEESLISQDPNINAEPYNVKKSIRLNVANESREEHTVTVRWCVRNAAGQPVVWTGADEVCSPFAPAFSGFELGSDEQAIERQRRGLSSYPEKPSAVRSAASGGIAAARGTVSESAGTGNPDSLAGIASGTTRLSHGQPSASVSSGKCEITAAALSSVWLDRVDLPKLDVFTEYVSYEMEEKGEIISSGTVLFAPPKFFRFRDPQITLAAAADGSYIDVSASAYARGVEIEGDADMLLEDNYFDMNAGTRRIRVLRGKPVNLRARSVFDIR